MYVMSAFKGGAIPTAAAPAANAAPATAEAPVASESTSPKK